MCMCDIYKLYLYVFVGKYTPQYKWLEKELPKVNRTETPWLIVIVHCPLYNSYVHHYMEGESMRAMYEKWLVEHKVDVVFSGHVHAYERSVSGFCFVFGIIYFELKYVLSNYDGLNSSFYILQRTCSLSDSFSLNA